MPKEYFFCSTNNRKYFQFQLSSFSTKTTSCFHKYRFGQFLMCTWNPSENKQSIGDPLWICGHVGLVVFVIFASSVMNSYFLNLYLKD